ncbi:hypothetical protein HK102_010500 [Quaeritorhiza haematococci]|nr:hypothetical protein HK102_010500 [Quaeritorhiza haematococci]
MFAAPSRARPQQPALGDAAGLPPAKPGSVVLIELLNPGNLKVAFHSAAFAFAVYLFQNSPDLFNI